MPYRADAFSSGQYYHIYNRGAARGKLFFNEGNYEYLLRLVLKHCLKYGVTIIVYCLMPNHYHFLLRQETDQPLSRFINVLFNGYVQALNLQQGRSGTLFEGRFRHKRVDDWQYLSHLCRYIHRNPVKAQMVAHPEDWPYSNFREWVGLRESALMDQGFIHEHFPNPEEYRAFVNDIEDEKKSLGKIGKYLFD